MVASIRAGENVQGLRPTIVGADQDAGPEGTRPIWGEMYRLPKLTDLNEHGEEHREDHVAETIRPAAQISPLLFRRGPGPSGPARRAGAAGQVTSHVCRCRRRGRGPTRRRRSRPRRGSRRRRGRPRRRPRSPSAKTVARLSRRRTVVGHIWGPGRRRPTTRSPPNPRVARFVSVGPARAFGASGA